MEGCCCTLTMVIVPQQPDEGPKKDNYTCAFQTLLMRQAMLQALQEGEEITFEDCRDGFQRFSHQFFTYENRYNAKILRSELHKLANLLSNLRGQSR